MTYDNCIRKWILKFKSYNSKKMKYNNNNNNNL
jgi:hypothetical protein